MGRKVCINAYANELKQSYKMRQKYKLFKKIHILHYMLYFSAIPVKIDGIASKPSNLVTNHFPAEQAKRVHNLLRVNL